MGMVDYNVRIATIRLKMDKGDWLAIGVIAGIGAGVFGVVLALVYGVVTVAKWAWGS